MKSIAQFNGERGITKWACQSCHTLIAHGYYVEGKLISVMRETHYHKKNTRLRDLYASGDPGHDVGGG